MHARFTTAFADVHSLTSISTIRVVVWIGIFVVFGFFIRHVWRATKLPVQGAPGSTRREEAQTENTGRNYRSKQTIFGLPLVHVASGIDPATSEPRVAKGVIAVGPTAIGIVAVGRTAIGIIATGIRSVGLLSTGIFSGGVISAGLLSVGFLTTGIISAGLQSVGLLSLAFGQAVGMVAAGAKQIGLETIVLEKNTTGLIFALFIAFSY